MQAVANALNLRIHVIESNVNFAEMTLVEPQNVSVDSRSFYIGHTRKMHYVSTKPLTEHADVNQNISDCLNGRNRKRKLSDQDQLLSSERRDNEFELFRVPSLTINDAYKDRIESKVVTNNSKSNASIIKNYPSVRGSKRNEYQRASRAKMAFPAEKAKHNERQKASFFFIFSRNCRSTRFQ